MNHRTVFRLSPLTFRLRLVMSLQKFPPLSLLILFRRRKREGFEQRGGGFSSGYENSDGMRDGFSGLREFSSAVDNGEFDNGELVSSRDGSSRLREFSSAVDNGELDNGELVSSPHNGQWSSWCFCWYFCCGSR